MRPVVYCISSAIAFLNFKAFFLDVYLAGHNCESAGKQEKKVKSEDNKMSLDRLGTS